MQEKSSIPGVSTTFSTNTTPEKPPHPLLRCPLLALVDRLYTHVLAAPLPEKHVEPQWPLPDEDLTATNIRPHFPRMAFKPTVVLFPSNASSTWKTESLKFPHLNVWFWFGSSAKFSDGSRERDRTLHSRWKDLVDFIQTLDPNSPETGRTVILSTITTWVRRTTYFEDVKGKGKACASEINPEDLDQTVPDEDGQEDSVSEEQMRCLSSRVKGLIGLIVVDEIHKLKNRLTHAHGSVFRAEPQFICGLSGTPIINRPTDVLGYLHLLKQQVDRTTFEIPPTTGNTKPYDGVLNSLNKFMHVNLLPFSQYMACLEPSLVRSKLQDLQVGSDTMSDVREVIAVVFSLIMLRRVKGHAVTMHDGSIYTVGKDIPIPQVATVKLNMDKAGLALVRKTLREARPRLYTRPTESNSASRHISIAKDDCNDANDGESEQGGRFNIQVHRRCMIVSFCPLLSLLPEKTYVANTDAWSNMNDHGYKAFVTLTTHPDYPWRLPHLNRVSAALEIAYASPKIQAMALHLLHDVIAQDRKVIFFVRWPITQWVSELFCFMLGIGFLSIRSIHTISEREHYIERWNDEADPARVLFISTQ